jgi:large subunit ribosomal protein L4
VIESINFDKPSTKEYNAMIQSLNMGNQRTLFVVPEYNKNIHLSSRNIPKSEVMVAADLNTYQIVKAARLVLVENSIGKLEEVLTA